MTKSLRLCSLSGACVAILAVGAFAADHTADALPTVKRIVAEGEAVLVDVREKSEWDGGHVAGAVLLPLSELRNGIDAASLAKNLAAKRIIHTHCAVGMRSCTAADVLVNHGFDVRPLKPGYKELIAAGFQKAE